MLMIAKRAYKTSLITGYCYNLLPAWLVSVQFKLFRLKSV
jgi:hypothetical protein